MSTNLENRPTEIMCDKVTAISADEMAIRDLVQELLDSWGRGDGYTYGGAVQ